MNAVDGERANGHDTDDLLAASFGAPVDLAAVQADDALLDRIGAISPGGFDAWLARANEELIASAAWGYDVEAELDRVKQAALCGRPLVAWRRDVDVEPVGELVDTDTALAAISAARKSAPRRRRSVLAPVAAVLAVLVIAFSVAGLLSQYSHPGDRLWPLHEVLYPTDGE